MTIQCESYKSQSYRAIFHFTSQVTSSPTESDFARSSLTLSAPRAILREEHLATFPCIIDCEAKVLPALAPVIAPAPAMHQPSLHFALSLLFSFVHVSSFTVSRFAHNSTQHAHAAGSSSIPTLLFWPCSCLPCFIVVVIVRLSVCWQAVFSRVSAFVRRRGSAGASTLIGPVISLRVFRVRASACITAAIIIHPATHNFDDRDVINK